jgi:hypothetical protein
MAMNNIKSEINQVITELEKRGIDVNDHLRGTVGLGDVVEDVLKTVGITEERFKQWFGLKECGCSKRKKWLNGLFSWKVNNDSNKAG